MSLLENPLIRKYFWPQDWELTPCDDPRQFCVNDYVAGRILKAMEEPIKKGELTLSLATTDDDKVVANTTWDCNDGFHPYLLRLPDRFQAVEKKGCQHEVIECVNCAKPFPQSPPAPAETEKCWCKPDQETCRSLNVCGCPCHKPSPEKCPEGDCDCPEPKAKVAPDPSREDEVERLIKLIDDLFGGDGRQNLTKHVRHLVEVVRNEAKGR